MYFAYQNPWYLQLFSPEKVSIAKTYHIVIVLKIHIVPRVTFKATFKLEIGKRRKVGKPQSISM